MAKVRAQNGSGGGATLDTKILNIGTNVTTRNFSNLTVGNTYRVTVEAVWVSGTVTFTLSSTTNCTATVVTSFTRVKNAGYNAWLGYIEYEIVPSATDISLTFDRGDEQIFVWVGEGASQITIS